MPAENFSEHEEDQIRAMMQIELPVHALDMGADGARRDPTYHGDVVNLAVVQQQAHNLSLTA